MNTFKRKFLLGAIAAAFLMNEAESETSSGGGVETAGKPFERPAEPDPAKPRTIEPSHWVVHKTKGLGMVGSLTPSATVHFVVKADGSKDGDARAADGALESVAEAVDVADLRLASADELPKRLGYTPEQLKDYGYA